MAYLLPAACAAAWGDLMVMGDGNAEFSPDEHLDAVTELLNQLSGTLGQHLTSVAGFPVQIRASRSSLEELAAVSDLESYFRADLAIHAQGMDPALLVLLFSPDAVEDLKKIQPAKSQPMTDRPPPAVLEETGPEEEAGPEVHSARFEDFGSAIGGSSAAPQNIDILMDLELPVIIELGRTSMFIRDILELGPGSIVELSKLSGEPVDLYVNDKKFAQGEVVVIDENFGIRITDLIKVEDRIRSLK
ncbi:MAG: flagellar motor switch protein FliN [Candidatus Zixiibacteriota bacterium]|nr:MAG: flagellar motor switch protein FliN [candidate division Zixibacteria bacterium]